MHFSLADGVNQILVTLLIIRQSQSAIKLANTLLQGSLNMSQLHNSLTYLRILLRKNLTQWSDTVNAVNLGFSRV